MAIKQGAYYNEFNPYMAQWLRNLIKAGHIAPGDVDERSITDVSPDDLRGYRQVHLFAGLGGWSLALRSAGVPDDEDVWSASFPCQPFSAAGAGRGFADERHLYPHGYWLISQCRPRRLVGEQVASKDAEPWLDTVQASLERLGYAFGAVAFPSAGVGAPHIRDRTYWVADAEGNGYERGGQLRESAGRHGAAHGITAGGLDNPHHQGLEGLGGGYQAAQRHGQGALRPAAATGESGGLADADSSITELATGQRARPGEAQGGRPLGEPERCGALPGSPAAGPTNGFWRPADWLGCRDGKWRPVEPGTFPLVDGTAGRVGRVRAGVETNTSLPRKDQGHRAGRLAGYGNAINVEAARIFIECAFGSVGPAVDDLSDLI